MLQVTASDLVTQRFLRGMDACHLDELARAASEVMLPPRHRIFAEPAGTGHPRREVFTAKSLVPDGTHRGPTSPDKRKTWGHKTPGQTGCAARDLNPEPAD
jgi:hypothetical protein